jgi:hypothetical protein
LFTYATQGGVFFIFDKAGLCIVKLIKEKGGKMKFFQRTMVAMVNHDLGTECEQFREASDRLGALGIRLNVLTTNQAEPVILYDRGDLLSGRRLGIFLDYVEALHQENPGLEVSC